MNFKSGRSDSDVSIEFDQETERYRAEFDGPTIRPSIAVVRVMAEILDTAPTAFESLSTVLDPEALDRLCTPDCEGDRVVKFTYLDHRITVKSYGVLTVQPVDAHAGSRGGSE